MKITKKVAAEKLTAYLHHNMSLTSLVNWAESAMMEAEFDDRQMACIRDVVARLGLADVRAYGLTWEDCEELLKKLGYSARIEVKAA